MKKKGFKRIVGLIVALSLVLSAFSFTGCAPQELSMPTNVKYDEQTGVLSWDAVEHADGYVVILNSEEKSTKINAYTVDDPSKSFTYSVYAKAADYKDSPATEQVTYTAKLATPTGVRVSDEYDKITWEAVPHAEGYVIKIGNEEHALTNPTYALTAEEKETDFSFSVVANARRYNDSAAANGSYRHYRPKVDIVFAGSDGTQLVELEEGYEISWGEAFMLAALVTPKNEDEKIDTAATFEIVEGGDYVTLSKKNVLTVTYDGKEDKEVVVRATSVANDSVSTTYTFKIIGVTPLTLDMISALEGSKLSVTGSMDGLIYNAQGTAVIAVAPSAAYAISMNGSDYYAEFDSFTAGSSAIQPFAIGAKQHTYRTGTTRASESGEPDNTLYLAAPYLTRNNEVGYNYFKYQSSGEYVPWTDSGFTNNLSKLNKNYFTWSKVGYMSSVRYQWALNIDRNTPEALQLLVSQVVKATCPYEISPTTIAFEIDDGEIIGVSVIGVTFNTYSKYPAKVSYTSFFDFDDTLVVPTVKAGAEKDFHAALTAAIDKFKQQKVYDSTLIVRNTSSIRMYSSRMTEHGLYSYASVQTATGASEMATAYYDDADGKHYHAFQSVGPMQATPEGESAEKWIMTYFPTGVYNGQVADFRPEFDFDVKVFTEYAESTDNSGAKLYTYTANSAVVGLATTLFARYDNMLTIYALTATSVPSIVLDANKDLLGIMFNSEYGSVIIEFSYPTGDDAVEENMYAPDYGYNLTGGGSFTVNAWADGLAYNFDGNKKFSYKGTDGQTHDYEPTTYNIGLGWAGIQASEDKNMQEYLEERLGDGAAEKVPLFGEILGYYDPVCSVEKVKLNNKETQVVVIYYDGLLMSEEGSLDGYVDAIFEMLEEAGVEFQGNGIYYNEETGMYVFLDMQFGFTQQGQFVSCIIVGVWNEELQSYEEPKSDDSGSGSETGGEAPDTGSGSEAGND